MFSFYSIGHEGTSYFGDPQVLWLVAGLGGGAMVTQVMSDLPRDHLSLSPPFAYVEVDTIGHLNVITRKTRGGSANSNRWAIRVFICLFSRMIHIEVVEEMSACSFLNAVRRFVSMHGKVQEFRSDKSSNFVELYRHYKGWRCQRTGQTGL